MGGVKPWEQTVPAEQTERGGRLPTPLSLQPSSTSILRAAQVLGLIPFERGPSFSSLDLPHPSDRDAHPRHCQQELGAWGGETEGWGQPQPLAGRPIDEAVL